MSKINAFKIAIMAPDSKKESMTFYKAQNSLWNHNLKENGREK